MGTVLTYALIGAFSLAIAWMVTWPGWYGL
jgi:hypothetical protein